MAAAAYVGASYRICIHLSPIGGSTSQRLETATSAASHTVSGTVEEEAFSKTPGFLGRDHAGRRSDVQLRPYPHYARNQQS